MPIIISDLLDEALKKRAVKKNAVRDMTCFHAANCEDNAFDIYHSLIGTPPTNPPDIKSLDRFMKGELTEDMVYQLLKELDMVEWGGQKQYEIDEMWNGIRIVGHPDFLLKDEDNSIVECKSWYGYWQQKDLDAGIPKTSYLKQLAVYMFFMKKKRGELFMMPLEPIHDRYQFVIFQTSPGKFKCNGIEFDITEEFARWKRIWESNVIPKIEPKSEYIYKYDIEKVDWAALPAQKVRDVLSGNKVIGDWQAQYSNYKNMIVEREGTTLGYTLDELARIRELLPEKKPRKSSAPDTIIPVDPAYFRPTTEGWTIIANPKANPKITLRAFNGDTSVPESPF